MTLLTILLSAVVPVLLFVLAGRRTRKNDQRDAASRLLEVAHAQPDAVDAVRRGDAAAIRSYAEGWRNTTASIRPKLSGDLESRLEALLVFLDTVARLPPERLAEWGLAMPTARAVRNIEKAAEAEVRRRRRYPWFSDRPRVIPEMVERGERLGTRDQVFEEAFWERLYRGMRRDRFRLLGAGAYLGGYAVFLLLRVFQG